jgi:hypothetical protein
METAAAIPSVSPKEVRNEVKEIVHLLVGRERSTGCKHVFNSFRQERTIGYECIRMIEECPASVKIGEYGDQSGLIPSIRE